MYDFNQFSTSIELDENFSNQVADLLRTAIEENGTASLAVSGGSTPKPFFSQLSQQKLDWSKVQITLVDDRWLPEDHKDSNQKLVKEHLLVNEATKATFVPLTNDADSPYGQEPAIVAQLSPIKLPLDVVILGMGNDGHTASLFPCCSQLEGAMDREAESVIFATTPTTAPYDRVTFSLAALLASKNLYLHIIGTAKKSVFDAAVADVPNESEMPIRAFLNAPDKRVNVMWAE